MYTVSQKNWATFLRPITLEILNRSLQIWHKSKSLHSEHRARVYLNQLWKIVAPSTDWRWHFYNYKFWIGDHFLTSFQPTSLHCYFTFLLINDVRMTTFYSSAALKKNISARSLTMRVRIFQPQCYVPVAELRVGYAEIIFIQPDGKLDTMWRDAWQRLASSYPTSG